MKLFYLLMPFLLLCGFANAGTMSLNPIGSNDQNQINDAIRTVSEAGGGKIHLYTGVYDIANKGIIKSNVELEGESGTIFRVSATSQWFTKGVFVSEDVIHNVTIHDIECDGNIQNLPREWDSTEGHDRDAEKFFVLGGYSNQFSQNIKIHDMKIYNCFSDAAYLKFTEGVELYNNEIINCQHEGFFISACQNIEVYNNKISGICSDGGRLDNSQYYKVHNNTFVSFDGDSFGAYKGGEAGLQIGDQGNSVNHGFAPSYKPFKTDNVEVYNNIFGYSSERAINLNNYNSDANIYIHDNTYLSKTQLEKAGVSFDMNYSRDNYPSVETSEKVFESIFDILNLHFTDIVYTRVNRSLTASIIEYNNTINHHSLIFVNYTGLEKVKYSYNENTSTWTNGSWVGTIPHQGNALYIDGTADQSKIKITCFTKSEYFGVSNFSIVRKEWSPKESFKPWVFVFIGILSIMCLYIRYLLKYQF